MKKKSFLINQQADIHLMLSEMRSSKFLDEASREDQSFISTIMSELAVNIVKYAGRGEIRVFKLIRNDNTDIDIWAEDQGPGILNIDQAMKDSFSTSSSLGLGLPAVKRMADDFWIRSNPEQGTLVQVRKRIKGQSQSITKSHESFSIALQDRVAFTNKTNSWDIGSHVKPMYGEVNAGDFVVLQQFRNQLLALIIDVTGHGDRAHLIGQNMVDFIAEESRIDLPVLFERLHERLKGTSGAAVGAMLIDIEQAKYQYIGVGNTAVCRLVGENWKGVSKDGLLGQRLPRLFEESGSLTPGDVYLLSTDGLPSRISKDYIFENRHMSSTELALDIINNFGKQFDDAGCVVLRWL